MKYQITVLTALTSLIIATSSYAGELSTEDAGELPTEENDKAFFGAIRLGMNIDQCKAEYSKFDNVGVLWHSGAPDGEKQDEFRMVTYPQRRIYVYYQTANKKIVSISYWKLGDDETFSPEEVKFLTDLNRGQGALKTQNALKIQVREGGSLLEVMTPAQYKIEQENHLID
jgi:hypothetical protein